MTDSVTKLLDNDILLDNIKYHELFTKFLQEIEHNENCIKTILKRIHFTFDTPMKLRIIYGKIAHEHQKVKDLIKKMIITQCVKLTHESYINATTFRNNSYECLYNTLQYEFNLEKLMILNS